MTRLLGAALAFGFTLALAGSVAGEGRWPMATFLSAVGLAVLVGGLTNPKATAIGVATLIGVGLLVGGRPMEGAGILLLLAAAAFRRIAETRDA